MYISDVELSANGRRIAEESAEYIRDALLHSLEKNHDPEERIFSKICMILCDLRVSQFALQKICNCFVKVADQFMLPQIYIELYSIEL